MCSWRAILIAGCGLLVTGVDASAQDLSARPTQVARRVGPAAAPDRGSPGTARAARAGTVTAASSLCQSAKRIRISVPGSLTVNGEDRSDVTVRADGRRAGRTAGDVAQQRVRDGWCIVTLRAGAMAVAVPRALDELRLESGTGALVAKYIKSRVVATANCGSISMDEIEGPVVARSAGGEMDFGAIHGPLRALSGGGRVRVRHVSGETLIDSAGGEIFVEEADALLRVSTAGNIRVGRAAQSVFAHTSSGLIEVGQAGGVVTAESGGGGIQIGSARGVRCESAGGTIRLRSSGGVVRASTASGNIFAVLDGSDRSEGSLLSTARGDVVVSLASNLSVTVKALNESGDWAGGILSEFPEIQVQPREAGRGRPVLALGTLNGGGAALVLSTGGGTIFVRRQR